MEQYAGKDMGGSSGSASETNRRKPFRFYGWLPVAQLICWELYFVSSGCLRSATRVQFLEFLSSVASAETHIFSEAGVDSALNPISSAVDVQSALIYFLLQLEALSASTPCMDVVSFVNFSRELCLSKLPGPASSTCGFLFCVRNADRSRFANLAPTASYAAALSFQMSHLHISI